MENFWHPIVSAVWGRFLCQKFLRKITVVHVTQIVTVWVKYGTVAALEHM